MKRRDFVQSLLGVTAVSVSTPGSLLAETTDKKDIPSGPEPKPEEFAYALGPITGPLARGLMPPDTPCPLPQSRRFSGVSFTGRHRDYHDTIEADTWYPSWADDGLLYTPFADGRVKSAAGEWVGARYYWDPGWWPPELWLRKLSRQS